MTTLRPVTQDTDRHVGKRLKERREALRISQTALGRSLGLTFSQIQKYEKGTNRIGAGTLYTLAGILKVDPCYFYQGLNGSEPLAELTPRVTWLASKLTKLNDRQLNAIEAMIVELGNGK